MPREPRTKPDKTQFQLFLAHGWDSKTIGKVKAILSELGISTVEWEELVERLGVATPTTFDVIHKAIVKDQMVCLVLFTPDEEVKTADHIQQRTRKGPGLITKDFQARPNVVLEAGMALALNQDRTVILEVGEHRSLSNLEGLNVVRSQSRGWVKNLAVRLRLAFKAAGTDLQVSRELMAKLAKKKVLTVIGSRSQGDNPKQVQMSAKPKLKADPVQRHKRLLEIFSSHGGVTSANWRTNQTAPDYKVMKEAESRDRGYPLSIGDRVLVQQHYESEYNDSVGRVVEQQSPSIYKIEFGEENPLPEKSFHVMYLSLIE